VPEEYGGAGLTVAQYLPVIAEVSKIHGGIRALVHVHNSFAHAMTDFGTQEQKDALLPGIATGELSVAFALTEPEHGTGLDLGTTAVEDGGDWVIDGHKWYSTNANGSTFGIVMAATEPEAEPRRRYSQIIVPTGTPGLTLVRPISVMGHRTGPGHWEVRFDRVRVPFANVLGRPGDGFAIAQARLGPGRIHHCMRWVGQAQRALEMLCAHAARREAFGSPLAAKQTVQNWIADSTAEIQAARLLTLHAAWTIDREGAKAARTEISLIKFFGAKVLMDVLDRAIQVHGGLGVSDDTPLAFLWRQARAGRIYDGPDEVHKMVVAREVLKRLGAD